LMSWKHSSHRRLEEPAIEDSVPYRLACDRHENEVVGTRAAGRGGCKVIRKQFIDRSRQLHRPLLVSLGRREHQTLLFFAHVSGIGFLQRLPNSDGASQRVHVAPTEPVKLSRAEARVRSYVNEGAVPRIDCLGELTNFSSRQAQHFLTSGSR